MRDAECRREIRGRALAGPTADQPISVLRELRTGLVFTSLVARD